VSDRETERSGIRRYLHIGTGNYNERTARLYTDFGLMTTSRALCTDASAVFNAITDIRIRRACRNSCWRRPACGAAS
jgi:polyphosphate kinase